MVSKRSLHGIGCGPAKGPGNGSPRKPLDTSPEKQSARAILAVERRKFYRDNPDHPDTCLHRLKIEREKLRKMKALAS